MSKDRLGPIVRAMVGVDVRYHGLIGDVVNRLNSADAEAWGARYKQAHQEGLSKQAAEVPPPKSETPLDTIIRVDRSVRLSYPDWVKEVLHPELEGTGPAKYDLATIEQWLHDGQKGGKWIRGQAIYDHLVTNHLLESCLGLADGLAIQAKGIAVFRKFFAGKYVFLWRSGVRNRGDNLVVPYLFELGVQVCLGWAWLAYDWGGDGPALRFAK